MIMTEFDYTSNKHREIYKVLQGILKTRFTRINLEFSTFGIDRSHDTTKIEITTLSFNIELEIKALKFQYRGDSKKDCLKKFKKQFIQYFPQVS